MQKAIFSLLVCFSFALSLHAQKPKGTYYVGANAGLNLRAVATTTGDKLATGLYGDAVEIITPAKDQSMVVDGITGGMAQVNHNGKTGYMFDGYLLAFPAPNKSVEVEKYVGDLWTAEADVLHEVLRRDWGGYAQYTQTIFFKEIRWADAFVIAKNLFGIPAPLQYHGDKGKGVVTTKNPNAISEAWTDELQTTYTASGTIEKIVYSYRAEGGGHVISIEPTTETGFTLKISELQIAD
ncbi:MAG: SH3 domain-containing protein [Bacteroidetes bacterium]|nr:SH3 domain-containing protein [Bacteroidota bacterium]MBL0019237.1 SH3 domain-containing protein [Bacteroidota bacterium]MBP6722235.1 SH3 domain-containing protein [Bacteroidia bacterium]